MNTDTLTRVTYRLPDSRKTVAAFVLRQTGEAALIFVPFFSDHRGSMIVIAHDDDLDGVYEDMETNWFNVESDDMATIGQNLLLLSSKLR